MYLIKHTTCCFSIFIPPENVRIFFSFRPFLFFFLFKDDLYDFYIDKITRNWLQLKFSSSEL